MKPEISLRQMTPADLAFADSLRALAGWNQDLEYWKLLLTLSAARRGTAHDDLGCFIAEWQDTPAGTATTTCYGNDLAWIGMVLVHPGLRGRGIGRALLNCCLEHLRNRGIRCIKLDATPQGKLLYDQLGFREEWSLTRWENPTLRQIPVPSLQDVREYSKKDAEAVERLDRRAFGVSRRLLVQGLLQIAVQALVHETNNGVSAYGVLREGSRAHYLGPLVAENTDAGSALVKALLARASGKTVFWDIPDASNAAVALAKQLGFTPQRQLLRMWLGDNSCPGHPQFCLGIVDPSVG